MVEIAGIYTKMGNGLGSFRGINLHEYFEFGQTILVVRFLPAYVEICAL